MFRALVVVVIAILVAVHCVGVLLVASQEKELLSISLSNRTMDKSQKEDVEKRKKRVRLKQDSKKHRETWAQKTQEERENKRKRIRQDQNTKKHRETRAQKAKEEDENQKKRIKRSEETKEEGETRRSKRNKSNCERRTEETKEEGDARHTKCSKIARERCAQETQEESDVRKDKRNNSDREHRGQETQEEGDVRRNQRNKEDRERYHEKVGTIHDRRSIDANWDITEDEFFRKRDMIQDEAERKDFFKDIEEDPVKAAILFHLNSGYARFGGTRMFPDYPSDSDKSIENDIDAKEIDRLVEEVLQEKLTPEETVEMVRTFYRDHEYNGGIESCGSCGIREHQRAGVQYTEVSLKDFYDNWLVKRNDGSYTSSSGQKTTSQYSANSSARFFHCLCAALS